MLFIHNRLIPPRHRAIHVRSSKRTGALAVKLGMTSDWDAWGKKIALTVLQVSDDFVCVCVCVYV